MTVADTAAIEEEAGRLLEQALFEVKRVIVGQDRLAERLLTALLAGGHCLLEGVPGVAKTLAAHTLATAVGGTFARIQFTPDLVPSDILGTRIYLVDYPTGDEELAILYRMGTTPPAARPVLDPPRVRRLQDKARAVFVHHALAEYVVRLVLATRNPASAGLPDVAAQVAYGASPRATLGLVAAARALALLRGREYVLPADIRELAGDVLGHRLVLSYDAIADGLTVEEVVARVVQAVPVPQVAPAQDLVAA